jgi:hypothetical protein
LQVLVITKRRRIIKAQYEQPSQKKDFLQNENFQGMLMGVTDAIAAASAASNRR